MLWSKKIVQYAIHCQKPDPEVRQGQRGVQPQADLPEGRLGVFIVYKVLYKTFYINKNCYLINSIFTLLVI